MNRLLKTTLQGLLATSVMITNAAAHERYVLPSHTLLSGDAPQQVTLTASISNDIFHPDRPLADNGKGIDAGDLKKLFALLNTNITDPTGKTSTMSWQAFQRLSAADAELTQSGTYRIALTQGDTLMTTFTQADATDARLFGPNPAIPAGATNIVRRSVASSVETFVSLNQPNKAALKPSEKGLALGGATHPNDLYVGEEAMFKLWFDGQALALPAEVKVIKAGTRHRNNRDEQVLTVNKQGEFSFTPPAAGFYLLIANMDKPLAQPADLDIQHYALYVTLEVFPE